MPSSVSKLLSPGEAANPCSTITSRTSSSGATYISFFIIITVFKLLILFFYNSFIFLFYLLVNHAMLHFIPDSFRSVFPPRPSVLYFFKVSNLQTGHISSCKVKDKFPKFKGLNSLLAIKLLSYNGGAVGFFD